MYATPFTSNGKPHGDLHEQWKRKTILTVANHFPYVKTRIQVVDRKQVNSNIRFLYLINKLCKKKQKHVI